MKCVLCDQRKAKRFCPAKRALICPQCCGEKRVLEIDCPETCEYLKAGRQRDISEHAKYLRGMDEAQRVRSQRIIREHQEILARLEFVLGQQRLSMRSLTDRQVWTAINILLETYRTEEKGILYDRTSEDLNVEAVRLELHGVIERLRNPEGEQNTRIVDPQVNRLSLGTAIECLEFMRSMIDAYMNRRAESGYVDLLARLCPREQKPGSIILP